MKSIKTVGIVGAGAMGRGIAQIAAQAGLDVLLFDLNAQAIEAARENLRQMWGKLASKGKLSEQRSEEHTSELQSLMRISYAVFCLKKKKTQKITQTGK